MTAVRSLAATCAAAIAAALFFAGAAAAQTSFPTDNSKVNALGQVPMVLDQNGKARANLLPPTPVIVTNPVSPLQYPAGSYPITGNATGSTGAVVGTLAKWPGRYTYICGFDVSGVGGTAAIGPVTVAGLNGGSMVYQLFSTATGVTLSRTFTPCIPSSTVNTAITITTTADGTASAVDVNSWGFQF